MLINRFFTQQGISQFDGITFEKRKSEIKSKDGKVIFSQDNVEVPDFWSKLATDILASKYFVTTGLGENEDEGETSVKQVVFRIVETITNSGIEQGYFDNNQASIFHDELTYVLVNQIAAFNSPVWFNVGLSQEYLIKGSGGNFRFDKDTGTIVESEDNYKYPQCSACFINSVEDSLPGIYSLINIESKLFKYGSGSGTNFSALRGEGERLSSGGTSSGLMSFLKVLDSSAGVVKSAGKNRRAAKLVCLDLDHPEIETFIDWKVKEEEKAKALVEAGWSIDEVYATVSGQNSNNSIRIPDEFFEALEKDGNWELKERTTGKVCKTVKAKHLWDKICNAAHQCADPGTQFDTTINKWHTTPKSGRINASNPCFVGDTYVDTNEGKISISQLEKMCRTGQQLPMATSHSIKNNITVLRKIKRAFVSGHATKLIEVTTEAGLVIRSTLDHKYLTHKNEYVEAKNLLIGTRLSKKGRVNFKSSFKDSVVSIKEIALDEPVPVYDLEIEDTHNFCVSSKWQNTSNSIVVHNCSEFMHIDNTSCNLASINLIKFLENNRFDHKAFEHVIDLLVIAQDIIIDMASYPTAEIAKNSHELRPIGLGFANLGTLIMCLGYAYDSDQSRNVAGRMSSFMTARAYLTSSKLAAKLGTFDSFNKNRKEMLDVIAHHYVKSNEMLPNIWWNVYDNGSKTGFRNSQVSVVAPTGTIGLLMDCSTTGIEPEFSLVKWKALVGGGNIKMVNNSVKTSLIKLGYTQQEISNIVGYIEKNDTIEGSVLKDEHLPVFDCAVPSASGVRYIDPMGHVKMMAAVQPFISGAISKTVNLPNSATVEDVSNVYKEAWNLGVKSVALYRDGCKAAQPLTTKKVEVKKEDVKVSQEFVPSRKYLPAKRKGTISKVEIENKSIFLHCGEYEDGSLGEIFITCEKEGNTIKALLNCFAMAISLNLQYGTPLEVLVEKFVYTKFNPSGLVQGHENVKMCNSIIDFIFRALAIDYLHAYDLAHVQPPKETEEEEKEEEYKVKPTSSMQRLLNDTPNCTDCGTKTIRNGACFKCEVCGTSAGCS